MENRIAEIQNRLESIAEDLTDVSMDVLRSAIESGESSRPAMDKKLSQARRAVEKAARLLEQSIGQEPDQSI